MPNNKRREGAESYAARVGAARRRAVELAADFFEASGVPYTCGKVVEDTVRPELERLAKHPDFAAYNVASTNNVKRAWDEVHRRWKARRPA